MLPFSLAIEDDEPLRPFTDYCDSVRTFSEKTTEWTPIFLHLPSGIAAHFTRPRRSAQGQPCSSTKTLSTCRTMRAAVAKTRGTRSAWGGLHEGKKKEKKRNFFFLHLWNKCQRALWHIFVSFSPRLERFNMWSFFSREDGWRMNARRPSLSLVTPAGVDTSRSFSCGIACARRGIWEAGAVEGAETFFSLLFFRCFFLTPPQATNSQLLTVILSEGRDVDGRPSPHLNLPSRAPSISRITGAACVSRPRPRPRCAGAPSVFCSALIPSIPTHISTCPSTEDTDRHTLRNKNTRRIFFYANILL